MVHCIVEVELIHSQSPALSPPFPPLPQLLLWSSYLLIFAHICYEPHICHCEFCFRILALSSHFVCASSSDTSAFMPTYIQTLSIYCAYIMFWPDQTRPELNVSHCFSSHSWPSHLIVDHCSSCKIRTVYSGLIKASYSGP